jgi:hypothetical protein
MSFDMDRNLRIILVATVAHLESFRFPQTEFIVFGFVVVSAVEKLRPNHAVVRGDTRDTLAAATGYPLVLLVFPANACEKIQDDFDWLETRVTEYIYQTEV